MRIGLDFDGVIADSQEMKSALALEIFNKRISPQDIKRRVVVPSGILTNDEYDKIQNKAYTTEEFGLKIKPVPNSLKMINKLNVEGHEIKIITSRGGDAIKIVQKWLDIHNTSLQIIGVGKGVPKTAACKENKIEVFVDDDFHKLEPLIGTVPNLFKFSYNKTNQNNGITEVESWEDLYKEIQELSK